MRRRNRMRRDGADGPVGLLPAVSAGVAALSLLFCLALVVPVACLAPEMLVDEHAVHSSEEGCVLRWMKPASARRLRPVVPVVSVAPSMVASGGAAYVSPEQVMQEMEELVESESPLDEDFPMLQMELLGDFDAGLSASVLWGAFYDLSRSKAGAPTGLTSGRELQSVVKKFLKLEGQNPLSRFYRLPITSYASSFLHLEADAARVPEMFCREDVLLPPAWVAVYGGRVEAPVSGTIRFVGSGNARMAVCFNSRVVLESGPCLASPSKKENPGALAIGSAIKVKEGVSYPVCIIIAGMEHRTGFALLWEHVSGKSGVAKETVPAGKRFYTFRTNICTPDDSNIEETQGKGSEWPALDLDSPVWRVRRW